MSKIKEKTSLYKQAIKKLENSMPQYLKTVGAFQWEGEDWEITDHHLIPDDEPMQKCQCCGHYPIREIYYVTSEKIGETRIVGNRCIDSITNKKIAKIFKAYTRKINRTKKNKRYFDTIQKLLELWEEFRPNFYVNTYEATKLYDMLNRLRDYKNLTKKQKQKLDFIQHPPKTETFGYRNLYGKWRKTLDNDWILIEEKPFTG